MNLRKSLAIAGTALLLTGVCPVAASASPVAFGPLRTQALVHATQVADALGTSSSGGIYLDEDKAVVNVVDDKALRSVRAAGLTARKVKRTFAALTDIKTQLDAVKNVPQTSWGIDTRANQVVVTIYAAATKAVADRVAAAAAGYGDSVRVEYRSGKLKAHLAGGDAIHNDKGITCSLGFNVKAGGQPLLLTAGHCTDHGGVWSGGDVTGAKILLSDSPGADVGVLSRPNGTGPGVINTGQRITVAANPVVGEQIRSQGKTTGNRGGRVFSVDETVNFDFGEVKHEFGADIVTAAGDSGGPAYDGEKGLGTLSGGNDQVSYYYPLVRTLQTYGLSLA
ncbi:S1 family peptidase [Amycolatopsis sp. NPDC049868]|uniref:S1 family peptidase n=1 Tax=Amycolatopsis sp. NPDC049868 TaxID=3363934 RepID=UPI0037A0356D